MPLNKILRLVSKFLIGNSHIDETTVTEYGSEYVCKMSFGSKCRAYFQRP